MNDAETKNGKPTRRPFMMGGLFAAAVGIAVAVYVSNGPLLQAGTCPVNEAAHVAIDAAAQGELAALNATANGRGYADLSFVDAAGESVSIADFSGQSILLNFWATWCGPCREEMPDLDVLSAEYGSADFELITLNLDLGEGSLALAQAFLDNNDLPHLDLYADPTFAAFDRLKKEGVSLGLPTTLLLDDQGCELAVLQGPARWDSADGRAVLDALLAV